MALKGVIYDNLTLEEFLALPEARPALEYVKGKVVQKTSPLLPHAKLEQTLWLWLYRHSIDRRLGECFIELRCTFAGESFVPDIVYVAQPKLSTANEPDYPQDGLRQPPDLIVEIISPGQTVQTLSKRMARQIEGGVRLGWLVQPTRRRVFEFRPGQAVRTLSAGALLQGHDALPGFRLPVDELFGWLTVGSKPFPDRSSGGGTEPAGPS